MNEVNGFVRADGQKLVNGSGQEILLRGVGLGGWLLPEGYMWRLPDEGDRPRLMERMIENLIEREKGKTFWESYYNRFISEADICQIAFEGFNSIRLPVSSRFLMEGFGNGQYNERHLQLIDRVIGWCRDYRLYVILDLHGAPGGQTGTNIDDSENNKPELFMDEKNKTHAAKLWRMLAERYRDEWIVAGYDLLNEPLPKWFSAYNEAVMPLYREIAKAIREVDRRHMIILEGVCWATEWSIFDEKIDDNLMLQFHKYWNNPDTESIQIYLEKREQWNVPIFMGEGGENNKCWYAGVFRLYEDHGISWNFWTWKKMNTDNSPCSVNMPKDWHKLVDYLKGGPLPDEECAKRILWEYLDNVSFDKCVYHADVVNSIFLRPSVLIPAVFYGFKGEGESYGFGAAGRINSNIRKTEFRINDGTDIRFVEGNRTIPNFKHMAGESWKPDEYMHIMLAEGDWTAYEFSIPFADPIAGNSFLFAVGLRIYTESDEGYIDVNADGILIETLAVCRNQWQDVILKDNLRLKPGRHHILIKSREGTVGVAWLKINRYEAKS